ncbi:MAG: tRNA guanosine(34) transglycosylase Tgt [Acidobacteriota bacterium]|nr:tRNA guanosine(34) transglycosylase Tgt [Acidobacteriota bacterium]
MSFPTIVTTPRDYGFSITHRDGRARAGELYTTHGTIHTPAFAPVGTRGAVKGVTHRDLVGLGAELLLANTYHLHLRPGERLIARAGGLHRFIGWDGPILTDSGGYQVFSLGDRRQIDEDGAVFRSHLDGSLHRLTPENATDIQARLGSDIAMVFDECTSYPVSSSQAEASMRRTVRWARRGRDRFQAIATGAVALEGDVTNPSQAQFGIVQGGVFERLREESARETVAIGFEGYAIGGLSVGEPVEVMYEITSGTAALLPEPAVRYLMGTGMPDDLVESVARGIDLFDCVLPTRNARNGQLLTRRGPLSIKQARFAEDHRPPDPECGCYTCQHYSRAYLRHLFVTREMTASTLNTLHNLHFYLDTMRRMREAIVFGAFESFRERFHESFTRRSR